MHDTSPTQQQPPQRPSVFICIPAYGGQLALETWLSTMELAPELARRGIGNVASGGSYPEPSEARNLFLTIWYDTIPTSHMLWVDSDMGFRPDLVLDMLALNVPLVGTLYRHKADEVTFAGSGLPAPGHFHDAVGDRLINGKFIEVEGVGFGITLVRRDCIDAMLAKFPDANDAHGATYKGFKPWLEPRGVKRVIRLFDPTFHPQRGRMSEDISFCTRARAAGIPVMASIGHDVDHVGRKIFSGNFMKHALECEAKTHFGLGAQLESSLTGAPPAAAPEEVTP